jgi:hypothetical protein
MLVRIRDRQFLYEHREESPHVVDDMFDFAGDEFSIDEDFIIGNKFYQYEHFSWLGDWLEPVYDEEVRPRPANTITHKLPETNAFIEALKNTTFTPNLQYITLISNIVVSQREFDVNGYKVLIKKGDQNIRIKFTDSTEYTLRDYFSGNVKHILEKQPVQFLPSVRVNEPAIHLTIKQLIRVFQELQKDVKENTPYLARFETGIMFQPKHGSHISFGEVENYGRHRDLANYATFAERDPSWYGLGSVLNSLIAYTQTDLLQISTEDYRDDRVITMSLDDLKSYDTSRIYMTDRYNTYSFASHLKPFIVNGVETHKCPITGIESLTSIEFLTNEPSNITPIVLSMFTLNGLSSGRVIAPRDSDIDEDTFKQFLDDVVDYLPDKYRYATRAIKYGNNYISPAQYEYLVNRNKRFEQYGIKYTGDNRVEYRGKTSYLDDDVIQEYDFDADIEHFGDSNDLHLGVELEVDNGGENHRNASLFASVLGWGHAYYMHDGSLDQGFEIATQPMTLEYHMSLEQRYRDGFGVLTELGYQSHNTSSCGLHIHFDRAFLGRDGRTQTLKASYLAIIMERNWEKFVQFSRRRYDRIDQWAKKLDLVNDIYADDTDDDARTKFGNKYGYGDKYVALNTDHRHTYELRIFRGTLKPETYLATLQFVDNLVRVSKECPNLAKAQQITFADVINHNPHKHLVDYITSRGILTRDYIEYEGE